MIQPDMPGWTRVAAACFWVTIAVILVGAFRLVTTNVVTACGGLDSAGYVGFAKLLLSGHLTESQPIARVLPFPDATAASAPLGFVASGEPFVVAPRFPPGLPMVMAIAMAVAGLQGAFAVAPALAIAMVGLVFGFARRTTDVVTAGLAAAILAVTPIFLDLALQPMSDVPAAFWIVLSGFCLWRPRPLAAAGALAAAMAILTRPPLLVPAIALGVTTKWESRRQAITFAVIVTVTAVLFAALQRHLYGNALVSGYGTAGHLFTLAALPHNVWFYGKWLLIICTPALPVLFVAGAIAEPRLALRAGAVFVAVCAPYLVYAPPFEDWEILRFLLPGLPFVFVVCAKGVVSIGSARNRPAGAYVAAAIAALLLAGGSYLFLRGKHVFNLAVQEQRYRLVGDWFRTNTPAQAVAISALHSGSLRIYTGRQTLRADLMPDGALAPSVAALERAGYVPYLALEQGDEYPEFERRFRLFSDPTLDVIPEGRVRGVAFLRLAIKPSR